MAAYQGDSDIFVNSLAFSACWRLAASFVPPLHGSFVVVGSFVPHGNSGLSCPASPQETSLRHRVSQGSQWDHAKGMDSLRSSIPFGRARSHHWSMSFIKGYMQFRHFHSNCLSFFSVQRCCATLQQRTVWQRCGTWSLKLFISTWLLSPAGTQ